MASRLVRRVRSREREFPEGIVICGWWTIRSTTTFQARPAAIPRQLGGKIADAAFSMQPKFIPVARAFKDRSRGDLPPHGITSYWCNNDDASMVLRLVMSLNPHSPASSIRLRRRTPSLSYSCSDSYCPSYFSPASLPCPFEPSPSVAPRSPRPAPLPLLPRRPPRPRP